MEVVEMGFVVEATEEGFFDMMARVGEGARSGRVVLRRRGLGVGIEIIGCSARSVGVIASLG